MASEAAIVCLGCDREIEACAFCDSEGCGEAMCYRCVLEELGETASQPHEHGG
jgi:hypothetical protein